MKIIQIIQKPQLRGAEIFASQLATHLITLGNECKIITLFDGDAKLPFNGEIINLNRDLKMRLWDFKGWKKLADLIKYENPDILQANAGDTLKFTVLSKLVFGWQTPIVFRNANKMSDFIDSQPKYWLNKFLLSRVDQVISVSKSCSDDLVTFFSFPEAKVATVEIGIELNPVGSLPVDLKPIFERGPVVLNVASMVPEKNQLGLLRIFSEVLKNVGSAQLIIIGKGKLEPILKAFAVQQSMEKSVHFLGYRNDVLEIMSACKAFLLPSHIEGLPGVILEAMYVKCPVVAYDVGGIREVVVHTKTGFLVLKDNEQSFVQHMVGILTDFESEQLKSEANQLVRIEFDNRMITNRFLTIYNLILAVKEK